MSDADHFYDLRQIKLKRLHELDKQAAMLGEAQTPAHIQVERAELRAELGLVEGIIGLPLRPSIGDELDPNGRFLAYIVEARKSIAVAERANDGIAALNDGIAEFKDDVRRWQHAMQSRLGWLTIVVGAIALILIVALAVAITVLVVRSPG